MIVHTVHRPNSLAPLSVYEWYLDEMTVAVALAVVVVAAVVAVDVDRLVVLKVLTEVKHRFCV